MVGMREFYLIFLFLFFCRRIYLEVYVDACLVLWDGYCCFILLHLLFPYVDRMQMVVTVYVFCYLFYFYGCKDYADNDAAF